MAWFKLRFNLDDGLRAAGLAVAAALIWLSASAAARAETRVALVIGNGAYQHATPLANPVNDATDMAATLRRLGFQTVKLTKNRTLSQLRGDLQNFARIARRADVAVIFFAGHGVSVENKSWLVPVDAKLASSDEVSFEAAPLDLALQAVEGAKKLKLVALDACRDNPFTRQMATRGGTRSISRGLAKVEPPADSLVWYSARDGSVALDGTGRNSPFTAALVRRMGSPGVELDKLFRLVRDDVIKATDGKQEPFRYGSRGAEDFYFQPDAGGTTVAAARPAPAPAAVAPAASAPKAPAAEKDAPGLLDRIGSALKDELGGGSKAEAPIAGGLDPNGRLVTLNFQLRFPNDTRMECTARTQLTGRTLSLQGRAFKCGNSTITLTLQTNARGDLRGAGKLDHDFNDVALRGEGWRYYGRSKYLPKVVVEVVGAE